MQQRFMVACADHANAAMNVVKDAGLTLTCCSSGTLDCHVQQGFAGCDDSSHESWVYCIRAGGAQACTVTRGADPSLPCGVYSGPAASSLGVSPASQDYKIPLLSSGIQSFVQSNWGSLVSHPLLGVCSAQVGLPMAPAPHTGQAASLSVSPCLPLEYVLYCVGTKARGLCTAYDNLPFTSDIGQYYFVNFDTVVTAPDPSDGQGSVSPLPTSSAKSDDGGPLTSSTIGDGSSLSQIGVSPQTARDSAATTSSASKTAPKAGTESPGPASASPHVNPAVIAAPIAAVVLVLGLVALFFLVRHLAKVRAEKSAIYPFVGAPTGNVVVIPGTYDRSNSKAAALLESPSVFSIPDVAPRDLQRSDVAHSLPNDREQETQLPSYTRRDDSERHI